MDDTILTWSASNWITVLLMVILGYAILAFAGRIALGAKAKVDA